MRAAAGVEQGRGAWNRRRWQRRNDARYGACVHAARSNDTPGMRWLSDEWGRLTRFQSKRDRNALLLTRGDWTWRATGEQAGRWEGTMAFHNLHSSAELFVTEVSADVTLLGNEGRGIKGVKLQSKIVPRHTDSEFSQRDDGYWPAYIIKAKGKTEMCVSIDVEGPESSGLLGLACAWLRLKYWEYGPLGRRERVQHVVLPFAGSKACLQDKSSWRERKGCLIMPVGTHLLTHMDDPVDVVRKYALPFAEEGDIITIGESPVAIMQGRFRHPDSVRPGLIAKTICSLFHPTSSLATACGMQSLVDIVGRTRVVAAAAVGAVMRGVGRRGYFYRVAGNQAALIDDVTGTIPPYDQFICLGPENPNEVAERIRRTTGLECAIVDVNDLSKVTGHVRIVGSTCGVEESLVKQALVENPAGNADEQTPLVIIRRKES